MCSDTTHSSQSSNSTSKNLLCSYKHNIVCERPICAWQIEANERSDWSLSSHYTINFFSTKILKIQNNPLCSRLRLKTKFRRKNKSVFSWFLHCSLGCAADKGCNRKSGGHVPALSLWSAGPGPASPPPRPHSRTARQLHDQPCVQRLHIVPASQGSSQLPSNLQHKLLRLWMQNSPLA